MFVVVLDNGISPFENWWTQGVCDDPAVDFPVTKDIPDVAQWFACDDPSSFAKSVQTNICITNPKIIFFSKGNQPKFHHAKNSQTQKIMIYLSSFFYFVVMFLAKQNHPRNIWISTMGHPHC